VNGTQVTTFGTATYPAQNYNSDYNNTTAHNIASRTDDGVPPVSTFDGYITEFNLIDGQALTPSSFGSTSATTGVWQPKKYAGSYGTNGFYLPFTDNSALTTSSNVGLGKDFSGNGNYWATNNISITAGSTYDSMTDVPTLTSATAANFAVLNPLSKGTNAVIDSGNLNYSRTASSNVGVFSTIGMTSGKYYAEHTAESSDVMCGLSSNQNGAIGYVGDTASGWGYYSISGQKYNNNVNLAYGASYTTNDIIGIAFDRDNGTLTFYKNGTSQGTAFTGLTSGEYFFAAGNGGLSLGTFNFGQRPFAYTPPTGFVALNTFNLPTPTIGATASTQANKYFDATTYTGTGATATITNSGGMQPDFVWAKSRSNAYDHGLQDSVRGVTKDLNSNNTDAEETRASSITAFVSNGFTTGSDVIYNGSGSTYVAWQWRASNATAVSNTSGSITSSVSANTSAGFSVVTYTGTGSNATVGHGLGVAPKMIILKKRSASDFWVVWQNALSGTEYLLLNSINAKATATTYWNSTTPSSTVFSLGSDSRPNGSGATYVAYCFSEVDGYSKMGTYTGTSTDDGTFTYTGFKPAYIIRKRIDSTSDWWVVDDARSPNNQVTARLYPNVSDAEGGDAIDFLSNGFKQRANGAANTSGATYIYMAFAETPLKYTNAR
jgi:hypothetical protein